MAHDEEYTPLTETEEWKNARRSTQFPAHHRLHIKETPGADGPIEMTREERLEGWIKQQQEKELILSGVRFDKSISLGAVGGILMTLLSWGAAWGVFTRWQGDVENRIETNRAAIERMQKETDTRVSHYIPQIDGLQKQVDTANNRLDNIGPNFQQIRDAVADLVKGLASLSDTVSKTHEEIMVLKARLGYDKRTELLPGHDRKEP